jgi:KaiC/GvpD/RAD55 family RecA-like ATPase
MAKRSSPSSSKKAPSEYVFVPTYSESRIKKREPTASLPRGQGGGLLQLKLGRAAQGEGLLAAFGLAFNAILVYAASQSQIPFITENYLNVALWLLPLAVGAVIGADAVGRKWAPYRGYHGSRHFVLSVAAFALAAAGLILILLYLLGVLNLGANLDVVMYPLSVTTIAVGMISMADTWRGWSSRKAMSVSAALMLPVLMIVWILRGIDPRQDAWRLLSVVFYFAMALAAEISGSMLHRIASSTSTAQREILTASDTKLAQLERSLKELQKALEFRQKGLDEKETIVEADRKELDEELSKAHVQSTELQTLQSQLEQKEKDLQDFEKKVSGVKAEIDARVEQLTLKEKDLTGVEAEIEKSRKELADREAGLMGKDQELKRISIEVTAAQRQLEAKMKEAAETEARLRREGEAVDARQKGMLQKEKTLKLKESELKLRSEQLDATKATKEQVRVSEMKDWEQKLLAKEKELGQAEVELKTLEDQLKERYENATNIERRANDDRKHNEAKERELLAREKLVSDNEASIEKTTAETERMRVAVKEALAKGKEREAQYEELLKATKVEQASATSNSETLRSRQAALDARQKKLDDMQGSLKKEIERLSQENRQLMQTQKEVERREQELTVKALEMETKVKEARAAAATPGLKDMDQEGYLAQWEDRLREKEEELKKQKYQTEKELEAKEQALRVAVQVGVTEGAEDVTIEEKKERVKSGTPRLDDLLYGGIPFNSNLLFIGPPFAGKEVVILNFVAEGLKKGIPAILVTTAKPPVEIGKEMAPILPTFMEYEQLGLVNWIDASGTTGSPGKPVREKSTWRVNGPADFEGILKVVNDLDAEFKQKYPYFRVAFLSLSSCIAVPDQGAAMNFVQRLVNRLRQTKAVAAYALERGMHTDQQIETIEHLVDGAIHFKSEKQKTMLQVIGLGEVQTRDWVPYKASNKAIMIGSFQLERIR